MTAAEWAAILAALGVGAIGKELVVRLFQSATGSAARRRSEVDRALSARDQAEKRARVAAERAEAEARRRRVLQEYASRLRRAFFDAGHTPEAWPGDDEEDS